MLPKINVHRPHGVVPKLSIRKRTVIDYRPSWLLLAVPALALIKARSRRSTENVDQSAPARSGDGDGDGSISTTGSGGRRRRAVVIISAVRRRRAGQPDQVAYVTTEPTHSA